VRKKYLSAVIITCRGISFKSLILKGVCMNELVFLDPNDIKETPFTTSKVIAEHGQVKHHALQAMISKYEDDLKEFGRVSFEMRPLETKGGLQNEKIYHLNEEQATLLITYMKNTLPVRKFKKDLVKQFYIMQKELEKRKVTREVGKQARETLTSAIQSLPESPHKEMKYKQCTDLIYKIVFGKNAKQLREEYGISKKDNLKDRFSYQDSENILRLERQVGSMVELGYDYYTIKDVLMNKYIKSA
jgi:phage regulator Rha-like protein